MAQMFLHKLFVVSGNFFLYMFFFVCLYLHVSLIISTLTKTTGMIPEVLPAADSCLLTSSSVIFSSASLSMLVSSGEAT